MDPFITKVNRISGDIEIMLTKPFNVKREIPREDPDDFYDDYENYNIFNLIKENQELKNQQKEFIEYLENEKNRLAKECSNTYEDSLGKLLYVNEDIFNKVNRILSKYKEIIGGDNK